jgi:hypothetical protein
MILDNTGVECRHESSLEDLILSLKIGNAILEEV